MGFPGAARAVLSAFADGIRPSPPVRVSQWLSENFVLVDGPRAGQLWSAEGAPYLVEIADCLGDDHPCNTVTIRKSQQSGASILGLGWCLFIAAVEPANTLYAVPGLDTLRDLSGQKFQPLIDAWQRHTGVVVIEPQTSRSGVGSTTFEKKFPGGYIALGNANSIMDLSSKTCRKGVRDEKSKWSLLDNGADPDTLFFGRFTAFRATKDYKILDISTPEVDTGDENGEKAGHCRIDHAFRASDRRFWNIQCAECVGAGRGGRFVQDFAGLRIDRKHPHRTRYACPHCTHMISEAERVYGVRNGLWVPLLDDPGREPGFHIDAFISLMMSYEAIAEDWLNAQRGTEKNKKDFSNLILGLPYLFRGDAPDHKRLMERREERMVRGRVPAEGLLLTAAADVQIRGIFVEVLAHGADGQTWVVEALYIPGDTGAVTNPVFEDLRRLVLDHKFPDAFGGTRMIDALAIDSGYRSHVVYPWAHLNQRTHDASRGGWTGRRVVLAIKGGEGWDAPAIGTPSEVDVDLDGRKIIGGTLLWPVGTWSLKSGFYSDLHKEGVRSGQPEDPPGYCHFGMWQDEAYFRQITAEHLADIIVHKRVTGRRWAKSTDNHFLDCRIYNKAMAEYLGASSLTPADWAELARRRGVPSERAKPEAFVPRHDAGAPDRVLPDDMAALAGFLPPATASAAPEEPPAPRRSAYDRIAALND